ncbi:MAG: TetR/AcrR family transcriptional regulator [Myxococcota bacterium]|nr:TetR/AcrR family transcriptional regulator [Myxococcota bacterium]
MPDTDPRKIPRQPRSRETVRAMLDATARILVRGEPLTTNRVAEVAGVSIGSLYQYFPGKEALVAALVERMLHDDLAWVADQLDARALRPQITRIIAAVCQRQADQGPLMAAVLPMLSEVERDAAARRAFQEIAGWLHERLRDEPDLRPELSDPARLTQAVFVATTGMRWVLNEAVLQHADWLTDPDFHAEVARLLDGLWQP